MKPIRKQTKSRDEFLPTEVQANYLGEWFAGCTIGKCNAGARRFLAKRGQAYFWKYAQKLDATEACLDIVGQSACKPTADETEARDKESFDGGRPSGRQAEDALLRERPWLLFESFMCVPKPNGKRHKDRLLKACEEHQGNDSRRVSVAFNYIDKSFRTFVRTWAVKEGGALRRKKDGMIVARQETDPNKGGDLNALPDINEYLRPALPDFAQKEHLDALILVAEKIVNSLWPRLKDPIRVAFAATAAGVSLANPNVEKRAGKKHAQLFSYVQPKRAGINRNTKSNLSAMITRETARLAPEIGRDLRAELEIQVLRLLLKHISLWLKIPENKAFLRFLMAEGEYPS